MSINYKASLKKLISVPYQLVHEFHKFLYKKSFLKSQKLARKSISIGNISFGGTGKTPFTMYLAEKLTERLGIKICILTRAYKSKIPKALLPLIINQSNLKDFKESVYIEGVRETDQHFIGDEATLMLKLVEKNPHIYMAIDSNRINAANKILESLETDLFILDDAQQHLKVSPDFKIILVNINESGFLREFPKALETADLVIYSKVNHKWLLEEENQYKIAIMYQIKLSRELDRNKSVTAFSGLGDNQYFFKILENTLKDLFFQRELKTISFPDHHEYSINEIEALIDSGENLICTAKDLVKIPEEYRKYFIEAELSLKIINEELLLEKLDRLLQIK